MAAFALGRQFQFELPATSVLLPTLVNCVKQIKEHGLASAGDFTIRPTPKAAQVATNAGSTLKPETNQPQSVEYKEREISETTQIESALHRGRLQQERQRAEAATAAFAAVRETGREARLRPSLPGPTVDAHHCR